MSFYLNNEQDRPEETEACGDHLIPNNYRSLPINDTFKSQVPSLFSDSDSKNWRKELYIILPHFGLVFLSLIYTVIGAGVFYYIEYPNESILKRKSLDRISQLHGVFTDDLWQLFLNQSISSKGHWDQLVDAYFDQLMETMHEAFSDNYISVDEIRNNRTENVWTFSSSFFFSITLITTIGYGHLVPKTLDGRVACLIFAVFGIPLILVTIADLGKFLSLLTGKTYVALSGTCKTICRRTCILFPLCAKRSSCEGSARGHESTSVSETYPGNISENEFLNPDEKTVSVFFVMAIWIGYTALGALLLQLWEPWTFFDSFYYCFITVTTIGFGDIVPLNKAFLWATVLYFVLGLVVTTMCVDLVGSQYIQKFHYFGRNVKRVTETALANWNGRVVRLGDVFHYVAFLQKSFGLGPEQMDRIAALPTDYLIECMMHGRQPNLNLFSGRPYIPNDIYYIKWIEQPRTASYTSDKVLASVESLEVTSRCSTKRTPREWYYHMAFEHMNAAAESSA
ncbi:potassium channels protein 7, TWiK family [Trichuris trichiura]|uniref:Potassium channels protein 7, TWiK family n=1 Tax=Trichuris trichiura TaxID=36087 RepID=A0A077Z7Q1_TRITR|nr:potassium channels protein 7, TWiK family [Trichuris trichiura]